MMLNTTFINSYDNAMLIYTILYLTDFIQSMEDKYILS